MKLSPLTRVENIIRRVMEEPFTWLGSGMLDPFQLAAHLSRSYDEQIGNGPLPNLFIIRINPNDARVLRESIPNIEKQLSDYVLLMTARRDIHLTEAPRVQIESDSEIKERSARIESAVEEGEGIIETAVYQVDAIDPTRDAIREADAFLILQGRQHVPLDRPIIYIGRRAENDIVLDLPSISRQHAQIRWRNDHFVIYNVSGHGRTLVNGEPVHEHTLYPGDVIALSEIFLVYGEGRDEISREVGDLEDDDMDTTMLKPAS